VTLDENESYIEKLINDATDYKKMVEQFKSDIDNGVLVHFATYEQTSTALMEQCERLRQ
jgi:hypothetical protein